MHGGPGRPRRPRSRPLRLATRASGFRVADRVLGVDKEQDIADALAEEVGVSPDDVSLNSVGPSWGDEISEKAVGP